MANKPLPGLPGPPTPRRPVPPYASASPASAADLPTDTAVVSAGLGEAAAVPEESSETAGKGPTGRPPPSATRPPALETRTQAAPPGHGNLAHRRAGSEGRIRQLYLPLRNKSTRESLLSATSGIDDMLSELGSPVKEVASKRESSSGANLATATATPPRRHEDDERTAPTSARSSRFSRYELRSGAGRELQRRLGQQDPDVTAGGPVEPLSPMRRPQRPPTIRRVPSRLSSSTRGTEQQSDPGRTAHGSTGTAGGAHIVAATVPAGAGATWYPVSPRRERPLQLSSDGSEGSAVPIGGFGRRRSAEKPPRGVPARPALNVTRVRTMDKLEIYLEYVIWPCHLPSAVQA